MNDTTNVATFDLAEALYTAQTAVYGGADWSWSGLSPETKAPYVQLAAQILQSLAPGSKPGRLFEFAVQLARNAGARA